VTYPVPPPHAIRFVYLHAGSTCHRVERDAGGLGFFAALHFGCWGPLWPHGPLCSAEGLCAEILQGELAGGEGVVVAGINVDEEVRSRSKGWAAEMATSSLSLCISGDVYHSRPSPCANVLLRHFDVSWLSHYSGFQTYLSVLFPCFGCWNPVSWCFGYCRLVQRMGTGGIPTCLVLFGGWNGLEA